MSSMVLRRPTRPTDGELAILRVLWRRGPSTVREVRMALEQERPTLYTTALKLLQIMFEKGLVLRDEAARSHVYRARATEQQTRRLIVRDLADRAFDGSIADLVKEAIAIKPPSREEAAEIRALLRPTGGETTPARPRPAAEPPARGGGDGPDSGRLF
jgi:BlaI family transcriptional regulator, penicillinase repressor